MHKKYAQHIGADEYLLKWVDTVLKNELKKEEKTTEEVEHILDYMVQCNKKVERMSYAQVKKLTEVWDKTQQKKGNNIEELPSDVEVVLDFKDGFKVVKLVGENAYKREGFLMRHCVGSYYNRDVKVYSLRDKDNMPHATMEKDQQIKGRGNGDISPKYVDYVVKFLEHIGMTVGDSEMKHLGYMNVEKIKKDLHKDTKYFNKVYLPSDIKLIDIDGNHYMSLDLLDVKPLIEEEDNTLKIKFDIPMLCKLSFEWLSKKKSIFSKEKVISDSGDDSQVATSGNSSKVATSGNSSQVATSGDDSQVATSGNYSKVATSGNYSQVATSGDYSQVATSGNYSQVATSGDSSQVATSGNYSQVATSGDSSKVATSGNSSKVATSGDSSKVATSGDSSKVATSGNSSQVEITGNNSVGANIGVNGQIKGKIGTWITLAEYEVKNNRYECKLVRSEKIDGKIIKEDTWYKLENDKLIEVI